MTITAYPFDDQDTSEVEYSLLFRELADSGIADTHGGPALAVTPAGAGTQVTVAPGFGIVRGHAIISTAPEPLTVPTGGAAGRYDRVVLRLDPAQNTITITIVPGTPGAGAPPLVQTDTGVFDLPVAVVHVPAGTTTITSSDITDQRAFLGSRVGAWTTGTRPAAPRTGRLGVNTASRRWEFWDGATWTDLVPAVTWPAVTGKPAVFPPSVHRHGFNDLDHVPASFAPAAHTHTFTAVTDRPPAYPPAAHTHPAADINTGTILPARLPVGAGPDQIAAGNHIHPLHVRIQATLDDHQRRITALEQHVTDLQAAVTFLAGAGQKE